MTDSVFTAIVTHFACLVAVSGVFGLLFLLGGLAKPTPKQPGRRPDL